jgi:hypothetical protein
VACNSRDGVALFTHRESVAYRTTLLAIALAIIAIVCAPMIYIRTRYAGAQLAAIAQPIEFDHRHHVRDDGIDCVYCHETVETEATAGLPSTERCMGCHAQIWPDSIELGALRAAWRERAPIRWRRVDALPGYVYFHHGVHIHAGIDCTRCHGDVRQMPRVAREHALSMKFCLECHREHQGGRAITRLTTCTACHR